MIGVRYPNGAVCAVGDVQDALRYAETSYLPTVLVRQYGDDWKTSLQLPVPRPRTEFTPANPGWIRAGEQVTRKGRGRGKGRQTVAEATADADDTEAVA